MQQLDNLVKINKLHREAADQTEFDAMLTKAASWLGDSQNAGNSLIGRFVLAYDAAHALAAAAVRYHGYRSEERYILFQCLEHTIQLEKAKCRVLSVCHDRRNNAHYGGDVVIDEQLLSDLQAITGEVMDTLRSLRSLGDEQ